jgi:hypothetical protein
MRQIDIEMLALWSAAQAYLFFWSGGHRRLARRASVVIGWVGQEWQHRFSGRVVRQCTAHQFLESVRRLPR